MKKLLAVCLSISFLFFGFNDIQAEAAKVKGGYIKLNSKAAGGRVDVTCEHLYMPPAQARTYATKSEQSVGAAFAWFGVSFIPAVGPYLSAAGLYNTIETASFVSQVRKYADNNQGVHVAINRDNFLGGVPSRGVSAWNQQDSSINGKCLVSPPATTKTIKKVIKK